MKNRIKHDLVQPDVFDVLSAAWVMACNDEQPIMTYEGIRQRLDLSSSFDVRGLIQSRGDLFRRGVSERRLAAWKDTLREGRHLPSWIRGIQEEALRRRTIDKITGDDVFRSQFRVEDGAPKASLEVIDWGLRHIDCLRKAGFEARDTSAQSWQMWLVFAVSLLSIAATITAALLKK
ncbi:MAG: hypothetical protein Q7J98_05090 [Kiritimatiellia bacterium]|nr:hypothetical protein [Kiritimatiellia bacterium]